MLLILDVRLNHTLTYICARVSWSVTCLPIKRSLPIRGSTVSKFLILIIKRDLEECAAKEDVLKRRPK